MLSKERIGRRLREIRQQQKMTLKEVEEVSGLSATHISEIERGVATATINALIRIAHTLRKDPSFFIEERELEEQCLTTAEERIDPIAPAASIARARCGHLTRGILGGRIGVTKVELDPDGSVELRWLRCGQDVCFYCLEGRGQVQIGERQMTLTAGDSLHGCIPDTPVVTTSGSDACVILVFRDSREEG